MIFKKVHETPTVAGQDIAVESRDFDLDQVCTHTTDIGRLSLTAWPFEYNCGIMLTR